MKIFREKKKINGKMNNSSLCISNFFFNSVSCLSNSSTVGFGKTVEINHS